MVKRNVKQEPDIREIRKEQAEKALKLAKELEPSTYKGELNDDFYYLVIREPEKLERIQNALSEHGIETKLEHRSMSGDDVLYLKDEEKPEDTEEGKDGTERL